MKYAFFKGKIVPFSEAKISIMTHAFNYGTGVFEGIRGYWNPQKKQKYILKIKEHYMRMINSCKILKIGIDYSADELSKITVDLVKKNTYKEDVYIRPIAYKGEEKIGLGLTGVKDDFAIFLAPFGDYLDVSKGIKVCTSSWTRLDDNIIPARAKITGGYANSSLAKSEAIENGFAEAILLTKEGYVSEGSGENIFLVRDGKLITPSLSQSILEGITRAAIFELAKNELNIEVIERPVNRSELYVSDELFFCGTGAQVSPIIEVDRRKIADGKVGPITEKLKEIYFAAVRGDNSKYSSWLTPVY